MPGQNAPNVDAIKPYVCLSHLVTVLGGSDGKRRGEELLTPFSLMGMPTSEKTASGGCRDLPFGILFVLNVAVIVALMVSSRTLQESFSWFMSNAIL